MFIVNCLPANNVIYYEINILKWNIFQHHGLLMFVEYYSNGRASITHWKHSRQHTSYLYKVQHGMVMWMFWRRLAVHGCFLWNCPMLNSTEYFISMIMAKKWSDIELTKTSPILPLQASYMVSIMEKMNHMILGLHSTIDHTLYITQFRNTSSLYMRGHRKSQWLVLASNNSPGPHYHSKVVFKKNVTLLHLLLF